MAFEDDLLDIIEVARLAPSVHNIQPWKVKKDDSGYYISVDESHKLDFGDPTGRQLIISLGIFTEAVAMTALSFGYKVVPEFKKSQVKLIVRTTKRNNKYIDSLISRVTDRSIYTETTIPKSLIESIQESFTSNITTRVVTDRKKILQIADLTQKGIALALSNPSFRKELGELLLLPNSKKKRGISVNSLYIPKFLAIAQPKLMPKGVGMKAEAKLEKKRWESASGVVLIMGRGDSKNYWFDAGRVYMQAAVKVEQAGLSQATSAAIVEASNFHEDAEQIIGTTDRVLSVIRIGVGSKNRNHSPRISAKEIIA